jgi:hypothetical protein
MGHGRLDSILVPTQFQESISPLNGLPLLASLSSFFPAGEAISCPPEQESVKYRNVENISYTHIKRHLIRF